MLDDFKRALGRVQSDYAFYIECQTNPAVTLAGYDLSPEERSSLSDPERLASVLKGEIGVDRLRITISGTHDWVNRTRTPKRKNVQMSDAGRDAEVAAHVEAIKTATTPEERSGAVLRLMEAIG